MRNSHVLHRLLLPVEVFTKDSNHFLYRFESNFPLERRTRKAVLAAGERDSEALVSISGKQRVLPFMDTDRGSLQSGTNSRLAVERKGETTRLGFNLRAKHTVESLPAYSKQRTGTQYNAPLIDDPETN